MKQRYIRKFKEEDSQSDLTDATIPQKLVDFLIKNPFPKDEALHKFAEDNKLEADKMEQYAYAMLTVILTGGKSKGDTSKITKEQLDIGMKIEEEHVELESDNEVIKEIQEIFKLKIASDHYAENIEYYNDSLFQDELTKEGK